MTCNPTNTRPSQRIKILELSIFRIWFWYIKPPEIVNIGCFLQKVHNKNLQAGHIRCFGWLEQNLGQMGEINHDRICEHSSLRRFVIRNLALTLFLSTFWLLNLFLSLVTIRYYSMHDLTSNFLVDDQQGSLILLPSIKLLVMTKTK